MVEDFLFVKGGGVSTRNYAKHVAPDNSRIPGTDSKDGVHIVSGVDVISRSPRSGE